MSEYIGRFIDLLATTLRQTVYDLVIALQQLFELSPTPICRLSLLHSSPAPHISVGLVFRYVWFSSSPNFLTRWLAVLICMVGLYG